MGGGPSPSGRGRRDSQRAGAPGEGRRSIRILRPSPCPLPEGEGGSSAISIYSHVRRLPLLGRQEAFYGKGGGRQYSSRGSFPRRIRGTAFTPHDGGLGIGTAGW